VKIRADEDYDRTQVSRNELGDVGSTSRFVSPQNRAPLLGAERTFIGRSILRVHALV
jgi:hypothetical protein